MHVTFLLGLIVPASYDEYTALVKSGNVASKHVWKAVKGADWHAFCQVIHKGIEGKEWEELYCHYREMSKATGAKKPSESQSESLLSNESGLEQG